MAVKLGSTNISSIKLGSTDITSAYLGSTQIFGSSSSSGSWSLTASRNGTGSYDSYGQDVKLSSDGSTLAVSAVYDDDNGANSGSAFAYSISGSALTQLGSTITGSAAGDQSGYIIALSSDGETLAIGANLADSGSLTSNGEVRVFDYSSSSWSQLGSDIVGDASNDQFGRVVMSSDGTRMVCSSWKHDSNYGQVKVFDYDSSSSSWSQVGSDLDGTLEENFGFALAMSSDGSRIAVGAPHYTNATNYTGTVRVYDWDGSSWSQVGSTINGNINAERFGCHVALSANGNRLAISAPYRSTHGAVEIYEYSSSTWSQMGSTIGFNGNTTSAASFGWHVEINATGSRLAISAPYEHTSSGAVGVVRVYDWDDSSWSQAGANINGASAGDLFGWSIDLSSSGDRLAVGAAGSDTPATQAGKVYVYDWD